MRAPTTLGSLRGEAKNAASSLLIKIISSSIGLYCLFTELNKAYAVDESLQLYSDLSAFLGYTWGKCLTVEQFKAGFHASYD